MKKYQEKNNVVPFQNHFSHISPTDLEEILEYLEDHDYLSATGRIFANIKPCSSNHKIREDGCQHEFRYSHIEYPPMGTYPAIPPKYSYKEVVICSNCGELRKTIVI